MNDPFEGLRRVPVLENTICIGLDVSDPIHHHLVFLSIAPDVAPEARVVQVWVSPERGGSILFQYKIWDDATRTYQVLEGPHGNSTRDEVIEEGDQGTF